MLDAVVTDDDVVLVVDRHIMAEYCEKLGEGNPGRIWLRQVYTSKRYVERKRHVLASGFRNELARAGCPHVDHKFVMLALGSQSKRIVSEEKHFTKAQVRRVLQKKKVLAQTAAETCASLGWK